MFKKSPLYDSKTWLETLAVKLLLKSSSFFKKSPGCDSEMHCQILIQGKICSLCCQQQTQAQGSSFPFMSYEPYGSLGGLYTPSFLAVDLSKAFSDPCGSSTSPLPDPTSTPSFPKCESLINFSYAKLCLNICFQRMQPEAFS